MKKHITKGEKSDISAFNDGENVCNKVRGNGAERLRIRTNKRTLAVLRRKPYRTLGRKNCTGAEPTAKPFERY